MNGLLGLILILAVIGAVQVVVGFVVWCCLRAGACADARTEEILMQEKRFTTESQRALSLEEKIG